MTKSRLDKLLEKPPLWLREPPFVISASTCVGWIALLVHILGLNPPRALAATLAVTSFVLLSAFHVVAARVHAQPGRLVYWPAFLVYEACAVAVAWLIWWTRAQA